MDLCHTPSADDSERARKVIAHLPEQVRDDLAAALAAVVPDYSTSIAESTFHFLRALDRLAEGIGFVGGELPDPTPKKMGMAVSSILMRAREVGAHWRAVDPAAADLCAICPPDARLAHPVDRLSGRPGATRATHPAPDWAIPKGLWLRQRCDSVLSGCQNVRLLASGITAARSPEQRLTILSQICDEFRREAWPALNGEDGLLKGLPRLQEEITKRIYQAEAFGE
ncbi:MAG TPA: hypothetical protein VGM37_13900 [Armatimonadota bacterium]|jgi:hypothetical protein